LFGLALTHAARDRGALDDPGAVFVAIEGNSEFHGESSIASLSALPAMGFTAVSPSRQTGRPRFYRGSAELPCRGRGAASGRKRTATGARFRPVNHVTNGDPMALSEQVLVTACLILPGSASTAPTACPLRLGRSSRTSG